MILIVAAASAAVNADVALGRWRTETKNGVVEIASCGTSICGKLVTSDGIRANPDLRDTKNKDEGLRSRKLASIQMLSGFTKGQGAWSGGIVYNADDGGTYKATVTPVDADHLKLKGCWFFICKTETWTRIR